MNSSDQVDYNLSKAESLLTQAKDAGADVCFLPENFAFMGHPKELLNSVMFPTRKRASPYAGTIPRKTVHPSGSV